MPGTVEKKGKATFSPGAGERGYTVVELMVTATMTLMLAGFIYMAYHFSVRITRSWQDKVGLEDDAAICMTRMTRDVRCGSGFAAVSDSGMIFRSGRKSLSYAFTEGSIFRNGIRMNGPGISAGHVSARREYPSGEPAMMTETGNGSMMLVCMEMELIARKKTLFVQSAVCPRNSIKDRFHHLER